MAEMPDVPEALSKKMGPLPLGGWLLAIAGGVGVAYFVRRRSLDTPAEVAATVAEDPNAAWESGVRGGTQPTVGNIWAQPSNPTSTQPDPATGGVVTPTTNEEWHGLALRRLLAKGYSPLLVDSALRDYLSGGTLDRSEQAVIAEALVIVGPPPIPAPPPLPGSAPVPTLPTVPNPKRNDQAPPTTKAPPPKPAPKPAPSKPVTRTHTVQAGDTLWAISRKYKVSAYRIYNTNKATLESEARRHGKRSSERGRWLYPGTKLTI